MSRRSTGPACMPPRHWSTASRSRGTCSIGPRSGRPGIAVRTTAGTTSLRYLIHFAQLPAFRHLSPEDYQDRVAQLIREIEDEGAKKRDGNPVAGRERILNQDPYKPPARKTKRSIKPQFHFGSKEVGDGLRAECADFQSQHQIASEALRGGNLNAASWFPDGLLSAGTFVRRPTGAAATAVAADAKDHGPGIGRCRARRGPRRRDSSDGRKRRVGNGQGA